MSVWIANISTSRFEVCLQESRTFDGPHNNIMVVRSAFKAVFKLSENINIKALCISLFLGWNFVHQNWMAYEQYPSAWKAKESSALVSSENELITAENSYAICKVIIHTLNA